MHHSLSLAPTRGRALWHRLKSLQCHCTILCHRWHRGRQPLTAGSPWRLATTNRAVRVNLAAHPPPPPTSHSQSCVLPCRACTRGRAARGAAQCLRRCSRAAAPCLSGPLRLGLACGNQPRARASARRCACTRIIGQRARGPMLSVVNAVTTSGRAGALPHPHRRLTLALSSTACSQHPHKRRTLGRAKRRLVASARAASIVPDGREDTRRPWQRFPSNGELAVLREHPGARVERGVRTQARLLVCDQHLRLGHPARALAVGERKCCVAGSARVPAKRAMNADVHAKYVFEPSPMYI